MIARVTKVAIALACLALALLVGADLWAQLTFRERPDQVLDAMPTNASALRKLATTISDGKGVKTPADQQMLLARRLMNVAPIDDVPLILAAKSGARIDAGAAYREALRRNPRNVVARTQEVQAAASAKNYDRAYFHLSRLYALTPDQRGSLVAAGIAIAKVDGGAEALKPYISTGAPWALDLLANLNTTDLDAERLLALNEVFPAGASDYIRRVLNERGVEAALIAWLGMLPKKDIDAFAWPYDAKFQQKTAPAPFNWEIDKINAEYLKEGGLFATYDGRGTPRLAVQTVVLQPGSYKFSAVMNGETNESGGNFKWAVECYPDGKAIGAASPVQLSEKPTTLETTFTVPAEGCSAQRIVLYGAPGAFTMRARGVTTETAIRGATVKP